ncbi:MAG: alpha/beta hydrolase [Deltaproteobacteria bacterium]|nr:alpha/beta hydrolase [Deltaproteobacteria bacterium]
MKRKTKIVIWIIVCIIVLIVGVSAFFWWQMSKPLYVPGMVSSETNLSAPLTPPSQDKNTDFWKMGDGVSLYHFSEGKGRNVLILHGGPGYPYRKMWSGLRQLTDNYRFHYYDQRGCGKSSRPVNGFASSNYYENVKLLDKMLGLGTQLADIERIRQILGDNKLILIGHSFGAFQAVLYAAEFPDKVDGLILVSPANMLLMPQQSGGLFEIIKSRLPADEKPAYEQFMDDYFDFGSIFSKTEDDLVAANQELAEYFEVSTESTEVRKEKSEATLQAKPGGWMVFGMYFSMGTAHDYRQALKVVRAPVLVIHGDDDFQEVDVERMYANSLPNARLETLKSATHFMYEEKPEEFSKMVGAFLQDL